MRLQPLAARHASADTHTHIPWPCVRMEAALVLPFGDALMGTPSSASSFSLKRFPFAPSARPVGMLLFWRNRLKVRITSEETNTLVNVRPVETSGTTDPSQSSRQPVHVSHVPPCDLPVFWTVLSRSEDVSCPGQTVSRRGRKNTGSDLADESPEQLNK